MDPSAWERPAALTQPKVLLHPIHDLLGKLGVGFPFIKHLCTQIPPVLGTGRREIGEGFLEVVGLRAWEKRTQGRGTWHAAHGGWWDMGLEERGCRAGSPGSLTADCCLSGRSRPALGLRCDCQASSISTTHQGLAKANTALSRGLPRRIIETTPRLSPLKRAGAQLRAAGGLAGGCAPGGHTEPPLLSVHSVHPWEKGSPHFTAGEGEAWGD